MRNRYIHVIWFVLTWTHPFDAYAGQGPLFEPIPEEQYPALVFVQEDLTLDQQDRTSLMVANFIDGKPNIQKVMTAQSVHAIQLADAVFLLEAYYYPPENQAEWSQAHYLVNFNTGSSELLARSKSRDKLIHHHCILSIPDNNEAIILEYGQGTEESTLIVVDLETLLTTTLCTLPKTITISEFNRPRFKISPDHKYAATMVSLQPGAIGTPAFYSLQVLDLETMEMIELDSQVMVEISVISSLAYGTPPFEWLDTEEILYQQMIPKDVNEGELLFNGEYVLQSTNVTTQEVTEWIRKELPLTLDGGYMQRNWFTGELHYQNFIIDTNNIDLIPYEPGYFIKHGPNSMDVYYQGQMIYRYKSKHCSVRECISYSKEHFAFLIRPYNYLDDPIVYAKTSDMEKPVVVSKVPFYTSLVTWIEDTSYLRRERSDN